MAWLEDEESEGSAAQDRYLKLSNPEQGKTSEVRIRILDEKPAKVFRHWIGLDPSKQRPYNCPSRQAGCVACAERYALKERGEDASKTYRMDKRFLVNALVFTDNGVETKIFSFGQKLGEKLDFLHTRHGDLRNFDITIIKRKTGPLNFNVEYDAIFEKERKLTDAEKSAAETRFPLDAEIKPSPLEDIKNAVSLAKGEATPQSPQSNQASAEQIMELVKLAKAGDFKLEDLGVADTSKLSGERAQEIIDAFKK
jgi:hypothetical protein